MSFLISGNSKAGGCTKNDQVQTQIVGAFHHIPEILKKFSLIEALKIHYTRLHRSLVWRTRHSTRSYDPQREAELLESMFDTWTFLPRTYDMSDLVQRQLLYKKVPCEGKNTDWIVKSDTHGGRGIFEIASYEDL